VSEVNIKEVQKKLLSVFQIFSDICEEYGLTYFGTGGTAIGAVRHKGFIPWDDDMDFVVPVNDYLKLRSLKSEIEKKYPSISIEENLFNAMVVVMDKNSTYSALEIAYKHPEYRMGFKIDIIPLCGVPSGAMRRRLFCRCFWLLEALRQRYRMPRMSIEGKGIKGKLAHPFIKLYTKVIPFSVFQRFRDGFLTRYPLDSEKTKYIMQMPMPHKEKELWEKSWTASVVKAPFEHTHIYLANGYDKMLRKQFGDYMKLPPEKDRVAKHSEDEKSGNKFLIVDFTKRI
jgi:lipopolysaccharide cholinephosphotransferase